MCYQYVLKPCEDGPEAWGTAIPATNATSGISLTQAG